MSFRLGEECFGKLVLYTMRPRQARQLIPYVNFTKQKTTSIETVFMLHITWYSITNDVRTEFIMQEEDV